MRERKVRCVTVWADEPCDRTEGHKCCSEVFVERYGIPFPDWQKVIHDAGDAFYYLGYVEMPPGERFVVEVVHACDGSEIREYRR